MGFRIHPVYAHRDILEDEIMETDPQVIELLKPIMGELIFIQFQLFFVIVFVLIVWARKK